MRIELAAFDMDRYDINVLRDLISNSLVFLKMVNPQNMELIGFSICSNMLGDEDAESTAAVELISLAIHPKYQREGFGQRLLERTLIELKNFGVQIIRLQVKTNNIPAIALYKKYGFRVVEELPHYYDESKSNAYTMVWKVNWKN